MKNPVVFSKTSAVLGGISLITTLVWFNMSWNEWLLLLITTIIIIALIHHGVLYAIEHLFKEWSWAVLVLSFALCTGELVYGGRWLSYRYSLESYYDIDNQQTTLFFLWTIIINISITAVPVLKQAYLTIRNWYINRSFSFPKIAR